MKKLLGIAALFAVVLILGTWACEPPNGTSNNPYMPINNPTNTPTLTGATATPTPTGANTATPTATIVPPTSTYGGASIAQTVIVTGSYPSYQYSPNYFSITHGQAVIFNVSGHTVYMDDGTGTGTCSTNFTSSPVTLTFASPATFQFHCNIAGHSSCAGSGTCPSSCSGLVGAVTVN